MPSFAELSPSQCSRVAEELRGGLCVVRSVLEPFAVETIKRRLAYIAEHALFYEECGVYFTPSAAAASRSAEPLSRFQQIGNVPFLDPECRSLLLLHPQFSAIAKSVLGSDFNVVNAGFFLKPAVTGAEVPWHQDTATWGVPPGTWTADKAPLIFDFWLALDPVGRDNGALELLPGSEDVILPHARKGALLAEVDPGAFGFDVTRRVTVTAEPGDLVVYHQNMLHRSDPNRSSRPRLAAAGTLVPPREIPRLRAMLPHLPTLERCPIYRAGRAADIADPLPSRASSWQRLRRRVLRRAFKRLRYGSATTT